jgi:hydroxymethylpyrimidine/phosphomethylpyrimidine kinase
MTPPVVLTIAGSDCGGGAGVTADVRTVAAFGGYAACSLTAVTVQDSRGVHEVHALPARLVAAQAAAVLDDLAVGAVKTGMLATAATVRVVAELAAAGRLPNLVVDPILVSSSGTSLLDADGLRAYVEDLLPRADVLTPNLDEAAALLERLVRSVADARSAAADLAELGPRAVVVTGGHGPHAAEVVDVVHARGKTVELPGPRVNTSNTHGTGCTYSAALAAGLARGRDVTAAARAAQRYVAAALAEAATWRLGSGTGPLAHSVRPPRPEEI